MDIEGAVVLVTGASSGVDEIDPEDFRALLDLNLVAPLITLQAVLPIMSSQAAGSIINVNSGITFADLPGSAAYAASKIGLAKLSAMARVELDLVPEAFGGTYQC